MLVCGTVSKSSVSDGFLGNRKGRTRRVKRGIRGRRSTQARDLPPALNVLRLQRSVNTNASIFLFRHTAPRMKVSFLENMSPPFYPGKKNPETRSQKPKREKIQEEVFRPYPFYFYLSGIWPVKPRGGTCRFYAVFGIWFLLKNRMVKTEAH